MKLLMIVPAILFASALSAHPNGLYMIDNDRDVTVEFKVEKRCSKDVPGALRGGLRTLTFSAKATESPYDFINGYFVEIHDDEGEVYVETDESCVPLEDGQEISATRRTFAGFALKRLR